MALAARQHGVVSREQCSAAGFSRWILRGRLSQGVWRRIHRGVYALGPGEPSSDQRAMAALLAGGPRSVLSHHTAAARQRLSVPATRGTHLTIPWSMKVEGLAGVTCWRTRSLDDADVVVRGGLRMTKVGRTVFDLAFVLDDAHLRVLVDSALRARHSNLHWMKVVLERNGRGHHGAGRLRDLLREYTVDDEISDSDLESFAMELGLATGRKPHLHFDITDGGELVAEVDLAWPRARLVVELDSWKFHGDKAAFQRDRSRDRRLALLGWQVLRYTWTDVKLARDRFVAEISTLYRARASSWGSLSGPIAPNSPHSAAPRSRGP